MELNIYIVDDDKTVTDQLSEIISNWSSINDCRVNTVIKNDLNEAVPSMIAPFDLVILDIRIGDKNGIEFAQKLRNTGSDATIAFISNFEQYAIEGYSVHAISYLLKPLKKERIEALLDEASSKAGDFASKSLRFSLNGKTVFIATDSIRYIEVFNKHITVHLIDKNETFYMSINNLEPQLSTTSLVRCHRSFIVNLNYVREVASDCVILLECDEPIPVGRAYSKEFKKALFQKRSDI